MNIGIWDGNEGTQMKDLGTSLDRLFDSIRILEVSGNDFELILNLFRQIFEKTPLVPRIVSNKGPDLFPLPHQLFGQMAPDEPSRTGHQNFCHNKPRFFS